MIIVVSGLPRSGTSMMMSMLEKAGIDILSDDIRKPDENNLRGYYEYEPVKNIEKGSEWIKKAEDKAVKVVSPLIRDLPLDHEYKVLFMERKLEEVLASQRKMMQRRGEENDASTNNMKYIYQKHLKEIKRWIRNKNNIQALYIDYNEVVKDPEPWAIKIERFLELENVSEKMASVVDPKLYRQRK